MIWLIWGQLMALSAAFCMTVGRSLAGETGAAIGFVLGLYAVPAVMLYIRLRGKRRKRWLPGFCHNCEYDLTGNESGVCPECGRTVITCVAKRES